MPPTGETIYDHYVNVIYTGASFIIILLKDFLKNVFHFFFFKKVELTFISYIITMLISAFSGKKIFFSKCIF